MIHIRACIRDLVSVSLIHNRIPRTVEFVWKKNGWHWELFSILRQSCGRSISVSFTRSFHRANSLPSRSRSRSRSLSWASQQACKKRFSQYFRPQKTRASIPSFSSVSHQQFQSFSVSDHTMSKSTSKTVVCVEGNIGCGKTSLLNYFEEFRNCEVLPEPVEKWQDVEGYNALGLMYKDPERWSMALQTYIQLTMLQNHIKLQEQNVRLMERSIYSAKYCFTDNLFESGKMPGIEHVILSKWFDWILRTQNIKVDLFVYLRTDPKLLHKRIMTRCRKEEEGISVDLLMALHEKYEDWFIHKKHPCPAEVLVIDANHSLEEMKLSYETHKNKIMVSQANN